MTIRVVVVEEKGGVELKLEVLVRRWLLLLLEGKSAYGQSCRGLTLAKPTRTTVGDGGSRRKGAVGERCGSPAILAPAIARATVNDNPALLKDRKNAWRRGDCIQ